MKYVVYLVGLPVENGIEIRSDEDLLTLFRQDADPNRIISVSRYKPNDTLLRVSSIALLSKKD